MDKQLIIEVLQEKLEDLLKDQGSMSEKEIKVLCEEFAEVMDEEIPEEADEDGW